MTGHGVIDERQAAIATTTYTRARLERLDALLEDPLMWQHIAREALRVRQQHEHGSPAWSVFTRLHHVADELVRLSSE